MIKDFKDKVALVTGAGSGIGRSLAIAFANEGMKIVIVDVNQKNLNKVSKEIENIGVEVMSKGVDVSNREQMAQLADDVYDRFGRVNVLCNNAGIGTGGPLNEIHLENWDWIIGVNLYGVIYGIHFFLKRMIESGEECHIVNTASMAGLVASPEECLYSVTKYGVVALSEGLLQQLRFQNSKVGISVLCPGFISTDIIDNSQALSQHKTGLYEAPVEIQDFFEPMLENARLLIKQGMHPDIVAQMVINSIQEDRLYIITHPDFLQFVEMRLNAIQHDASELDEAMRKQRLIGGAEETTTYTHQNPGFSISYPADWIIQNQTPITDYDFRAVSDTIYPSLAVRVLEIPEGGLNASMNVSAQILSQAMGMETRIVSSMETSLKDGSPSMEGEIEIQLPGANRIICLVLNTIKDNKLINIVLSSVRSRYDENMKKKLQDIAYTLMFD